MKVTTIESNLETGETSITKDGMKFDGMVGLIQSQYITLVEHRDDGRVPSQMLLDDIATYHYILSSKDPVATTKIYFDNRDGEPGRRSVGKKLGWIK